MTVVYSAWEAVADELPLDAIFLATSYQPWFKPASAAFATTLEADSLETIWATVAAF